ncbi:CRAL-TRIO domain-containing protein [Paraphysoderma sedebokerense]|nr:CRAL-TRIO domain-containing protein [Paraphysoderma sedebokerense]
MVTNELQSPTRGRLGNLTPEESKALAEAWLVLLEFWYSDPDAPVNVNELDKEFRSPNVSNGIPVSPTINRETAPPIISTRTPKVITRTYLRQLFWLSIAGFHPSDVLLRFLRVRQFNVKEALLMLGRAGFWRADNQIQTLIEKGERILPKGLLQGQTFTHKTDKAGRPVLYINVTLHQKGVHTQEEIEIFLRHSLETQIPLLKEPGDALTLIWNLNGLTMKNMDLGLVKYHSVGLCLMVDAPWIFNGFWKAIQPLLEPQLKAVVKFIKTAELKNYIDPENLPKQFGGSDPYTFKYVPPSSAEMERKVDKQLKKQLLVERMEEVVQVEQYFLNWAVETYTKGPQKYDKEKDDAVLKKLVRNYWDYDEVTRFPTIYHRAGIVNKDVCDWSKAS